MTVYTDALPDRLPDTDAITTAAKDITAHATKANTLVDYAHADLSGVGTHFAAPDTALVESAMHEIVRPFAADIETSIGPVTTGLDSFASDIENLKARYDRVREDVAEHNDWQRPPADDPHQDTYDLQESNLEAEVRAVGSLYDEAVERCEEKIRQGTPSPVPGFPVSPGVMFGVGASLSTTQKWFEIHVSFVRVRNGRVNIQVSEPIPRRGHKISTKVMSKLGMPDSYVNKYANLFDPETGQRMSIADWERAMDEVKPRSALGILFARSPWMKQRFLDAHVRVERNNVKGPRNGRVNADGSARIIAEDPKGVPPRAHGKNQDKTLKHPASGKWGKAVQASKVAGRGLGILGFAGNVLGGLVGGQIGKGINAFRHSDGDSFGEKAQDFVGGLFKW